MYLSQLAAVQMDVTQWILIGFIVLLIIVYPILAHSRNKKENQKMQEQANSLKRGDKVLTTSGVYGTIVDLEMAEDKKVVTIETGSGKNKGYITVDAYAIYQVFSKEPKVAPQDKASEVKAVEAPKEEVKEVKTEQAATPVETKTESDDTVASIEEQISGKKPKKTKTKKSDN